MGALVKVEYISLPVHKKGDKTITVPDGVVSFPVLIKAITGINAHQNPFYSDTWTVKGQNGSEAMDPTFELTKMSISGSQIVLEKFRKNTLKELVVDAKKLTIREDAFNECESLEKVLLSAGSACIEDFAFWGCHKLSTLTLPEGLTSIGNNAFRHCSELGHVSFPAGLREIGKEAFASCKLTAAILPDTVVSIGANAFSLCKHLQYASMPSDAKLGKVFKVRGYSSSFPFSDCDDKTLIFITDQGGSEGLSPDSLFHGYVTTPKTESGVRILCQSKAVDPTLRKKAAEIVRNAPIAGKTTERSGITNDAESLRKYLKLVSDAETSVLQLSELYAHAASVSELIEAAMERRIGFDDYTREELEEEQRAKVAEQRKEYNSRRRSILDGELLTINDTGKKPIKPEAEPEPKKPEPPRLEKPGLFNRKKVEARNAELEAQYRDAISKYEEMHSQWRETVANANTKFAEDLATWQENRDKVIKRQLDELGPFKPRDCESLENYRSDILISLEGAVTAYDAMCGELEKQLSVAGGMLKLAYSADVIFPKYRTIEAVTTMYEYLETGRCSTLQGPNGAYNLYESEVRSNAIISKLDIVSGKLDAISRQLSAIQSNQYTLFKAVEGIGMRLDSMSATLGSILEETKATRSATQDLSSKAIELVRNSAEIAYWTRRNAELTDSLGYLIAFTAV